MKLCQISNFTLENNFSWLHHVVETENDQNSVKTVTWFIELYKIVTLKLT